MDLQALRIFKAVADEGSVTRAAGRLHYVQSNVTARLRGLEEALGTELFHRTGRRLAITPAGRTLLAYAEQILGLAEAARQAVRADDVPQGTLVIGSMETMAAARLPAALSAFHRAHPQVELQLETGTTEALLADVLAYRLDCALVAGPQHHPELHAEPVFVEELVLITEAAHPPVGGPRDLHRPQMLSFRSGCAYRGLLERWLIDGGVRPARIASFGTFEAIIGCVAAGMGVSLMPASVVEPHRRLGTIRTHRIEAAYAQVATLLVWRRDQARHAAREAFQATLRACAGSTEQAA